MAHLPLDPDVAADIAAQIAAFPRSGWHGSCVAEFDALPCYSDLGGTIGLRASGEIVGWTHEGEHWAIPVEDYDRWRLIALVAGARRYPGLRVLLPVRGP